MKVVVEAVGRRVDSSVAAYLLKQQGYGNVKASRCRSGKRGQSDGRRRNGGCCGLSAVEDAGESRRCLGHPLLCHEFPRGV